MHYSYYTKIYLSRQFFMSNSSSSKQHSWQ